MTTQNHEQDIPEPPDPPLQVTLEDAPHSYAAQEAPRRLRRRLVTICAGVAAVVALVAAVAGTLSPDPKPSAAQKEKKDIMAAVPPSASAVPAERLTAPEPPLSAAPVPSARPQTTMQEPSPAAPAGPQDQAAAKLDSVAPAAGPAPPEQTAALTDGPPPPPPSAVDASPAAAAPEVEPPAPVREAAAAAAKKAPGAVVPAVGGDYAVQFAAVSNAGRATKEAAKLQKQLAAVLGGRAVKVLKAELKGKGTIYRIRAEGYKTRQMAQDACHAAAKLKVPACVATRR